ncbi:MAG: long-chain fatty acid--CoA ligase [Elusimicrobia bacterium]|nr:long-chain fatty acid--CoA ligase [Elusimicrobiota bacterium]
MSTLPELIRSRAAQEPAAPFVFFKDEEWTRGELDRASDAVAWQLIGSGIKPGERVAMLLPNCPEFVVYYFAILKAGAIAVPVNVWLKSPEIVYILQNSGAAGAVLGPAHHGMEADFLAQCPALAFSRKVALPSKDSLLALPAGDPAGLAAAAPRAADPATIIYTSGTTGFPKGAVLTHRNWLFDAEAFIAAAQLTAADRVLAFLPLFHVNSQCVALIGPLLVGGSMALMEKFAPKEFFECLSRRRCSVFSGVPSIYTVLLSLPEAERYDLSSLRFCICGAAPMPVDVFERFEAKFKAHILEGYGLSEGTCVASANPPPPGRRKIGSIGLPIPGVEMRIVDSEDRTVPDGAVGEIALRGESVMSGYWGNPAASAEALKGGWLHTGDLGTRDADGFFTIVGRKKEMLIRGGENIYPKEIEEALYTHEAVQEAAVIGLPDRRYGEEVAAFVVLKDGSSATPTALAAFLKDKLADYKIPKRFEFVVGFPKTATGKIQKLKLRDEYLASAGT